MISPELLASWFIAAFRFVSITACKCSLTREQQSHAYKNECVSISSRIQHHSISSIFLPGNQPSRDKLLCQKQPNLSARRRPSWLNTQLLNVWQKICISLSNTMQGQRKLLNRTWTTLSQSRVLPCIEPRSIHLGQARCASHPGRLLPHRPQSRP